MKKDLWNRTGNSTEKDGNILYEAKNSKRIDICLCITEWSSYIPKTKHRKSTRLQYKIIIKLQIKLPELGLGDTRQWWPLWLDMGYADINTTPPKVFTQQNTEQQPAWPHVNVTRWREGKGPQVIQGNTLNSDPGNLRGDRTHCRERADMWSPCTQDPDPRGWGEGHTIHRACTGAHFHTLQGDTTSPDPAPGVTRPLVRTPGLCWAPKVETSGFL